MLCCVLADGVLAWPDIQCDSNYGDGNVVVILLVFWCKPGARVSDALKIYSSIWKPQIQLSMALGWLIMKIPIHISSICHKQNVNIRAEEKKNERGREMERRDWTEKHERVKKNCCSWKSHFEHTDNFEDGWSSFLVAGQKFNTFLFAGELTISGNKVWVEETQFKYIILLYEYIIIYFVYHERTGYDLLYLSSCSREKRHIFGSK